MSRASRTTTYSTSAGRLTHVEEQLRGVDGMAPSRAPTRPLTLLGRGSNNGPISHRALGCPSDDHVPRSRLVRHTSATRVAVDPLHQFFHCLEISSGDAHSRYPQ